MNKYCKPVKSVDVDELVITEALTWSDVPEKPSGKQSAFYRVDEAWIQAVAFALGGRGRGFRTQGSPLQMLCALRIYRLCLYRQREARSAVASNRSLCDNLVTHDTKSRTIDALEMAGLLVVNRRRRGLAPIVSVILPIEKEGGYGLD